MKVYNTVILEIFIRILIFVGGAFYTKINLPENLIITKYIAKWYLI